jgi:hypothetical protein
VWPEGLGKFKNSLNRVSNPHVIEEMYYLVRLVLLLDVIDVLLTASVV